MQSFNILKKDYDVINQQIKKISREGHDIQLHIHLIGKIVFGKQWVFDTRASYYWDRLDYCNEVYLFLKKYLKPTIFRAGLLITI